MSRLPASLIIACGLGLAACAPSASLDWAQTAPIIEPLPRSPSTIRLGLRADLLGAPPVEDAEGHELLPTVD